MLPEILKALSLAMISICWIERWTHIYTDVSTICHNRSVGAGFSCPSYFEGRVAMGNQPQIWTQTCELNMRQHDVCLILM